MKHRILLATVLAAAVVSAAVAKPITFELPADTSQLKPGPNLDVVQANCGACHSADYVLTQPIGPKFKKDFWQAEVTKMIKVYGAPIDEKDVPAIVDYLTATY